MWECGSVGVGVQGSGRREECGGSGDADADAEAVGDGRTLRPPHLLCLHVGSSQPQSAEHGRARALVQINQHRAGRWARGKVQNCAGAEGAEGVEGAEQTGCKTAFAA